MKKIFLVSFLIILLGIFLLKFTPDANEINNQPPPKRVWIVKSVDTMKYSRDLTGEKLGDPTFDQTIDLHTRSIADTGATHVAIGTPYDEKFIPYLTRWIQAARSHGLKVWFRGNFSGWEGWFGYKKNLTRSEHLDLMRQFINKNGALFDQGDIFSPCPECENGVAGDPRKTGDVSGFRKFMIDEHQAANAEFRKIGKNVRIVGSMNYDVAALVMDEATANAVGNLIVIDHYVKSPQDLAADITKIALKTKANVMLGELGVPIPDIHGKLTEEEQGQWLEEAMSLIVKDESVIGINYWVGYGGSTAIFANDGTKKPAAQILEKYFSLANLD